MSIEAKYEAFAKAKLSPNPGMEIGPSILGLTMDLLLCGVSCHQFLVYHRANVRKDRLLIRILLYWMFTMSSVSTVYELWHMYSVFVSDFGRYLGFIHLNRYCVYPALVMSIALPAQLFYLDRAYRLWNKNIWVPAVFVPGMIGHAVCAIGSSVAISKTGYIPDLTIVLKWFYGWDACTISTDVALTCIILRGLMRAKTGWTHTDRTLTKLTRTSAEAQLFPMMMAIGILITSLVKPDSHLAFFWFQTTGKSYVVSMLAVLNFRIMNGDASSSGNYVKPSLGDVDAATNDVLPLQVHVHTRTTEEHEMNQFPGPKGEV